jgi:mannonate dehydratase
MSRYFLQGIMPTAEKYNVQMACHLNDPPAPLLRGVEQWNFPVFEGIRRFSELVDSPMHGFNFCCGTAAEGTASYCSSCGRHHSCTQTCMHANS